MSNWYKIEPVNKKSIIDNQFWSMTEDDGNEIRFSVEETNRWGYFVVKTDKTLDQVKDDLNYDDDKYGQFDSDDWEIEDMDFYDICAVDYNNCHNIDEETLQQLAEENPSWEDHGYNNEGYRYDIYGKMNVTDVTDEYRT